MSVFIRVTIDIPDKLFDYKVFEDTLMRGQDKLTEETGKDFEYTASTFMNPDDKPAIVIEHTTRRGDVYKSAAIAVGKVYKMLNDGTPAHPIRARNKEYLKFQHGSGFMPATMPGVIMPFGARNDGEDVFAKAVEHPGTKARRFDLAIAAKHKDDLKPIGLAAIQAGLKAAK